MLSATNVEVAEVKAGDVNYVTFYDKKVQDFLIENLKKAYPNAYFIAEEKDNDNNALQNDLCFIIDPIDGTTNFIRDYKSSSISIGLFSNSDSFKGSFQSFSSFNFITSFEVKSGLNSALSKKTCW